MTTNLNSQEAGLVARRVSIDEAFVAFPAMMNPRERWNGWACPYFAREAVERIATEMAKDDYYRITFDGDCVVLTDLQAEETDEFRNDVIPPTLIDGQKYWPVGSWGWVWSDDDEDNCIHAKDYEPCLLGGCSHRDILVETPAPNSPNFWADTADQALWRLLVINDGLLSYGTAEESDAAEVIVRSASAEIARRYGPDATEWSAQRWIKASTEDMLRDIDRNWKTFDMMAREASAILREEAILRAMSRTFAAWELTWSWEHPGIFEFTTPDGREWATGLMGWHYATDRTMQTDAMLEIAAEAEDIKDWTPQTIAENWIEIIKGEQA